MSRESSLGAWADKIPQVEGHAAGQSWQAAPQEREPLTSAEMTQEMKGIGILILIGLGLLFGSGIFFLWSLSVTLGGEETTGVVVDYHERRSRKGTTYAPVVAYYADGGEYEITSSMATSWKPYAIGDEVPVLYSPDDPESASLNSFTSMWLLPMLLGGGGLVFVLGGLGLGTFVAKKAGWRLLPG